MPTATATAAPTWDERILGGAAYLCWVLPPFYLVPLLLCRWKRKTSRFVALHAAQSVLLASALHILYFVVAATWSSVTGLIKTRTHVELLNSIVTAVLLGMLVWGYLGMPIVPLRGRPAALPVLARWAARILDSPPGVAAGKSAAPAYTAQTPEDRLLAGAAYISLLSFGPFLVGPLVVYFWKRKSSRFVEFHALQALLLHVLLIPVALAAFMSGIFAAAVMVRGGRGSHGYSWADAAVEVGWMVAVASPSVILWRGVAAMLGPPDAVPLLGRLARWIDARSGRG